MFEKLTVVKLVNKLSAFYGTLRLLSCPQGSAIGKYPEPDEHSPHVCDL